LKYKIIKGLSSHDCNYAFWTGWPAKLKTEDGYVEVFVKKMTRLEDDKVLIAGNTKDGISYFATMASNQHRKDYTTGELNLED